MVADKSWQTAKKISAVKEIYAQLGITVDPQHTHDQFRVRAVDVRGSKDGGHAGPGICSLACFDFILIK